MKSINKTYNRFSRRLNGCDYSTKGAYFITICSNKGRFVFGSIVDNTIWLNNWGVIVEEEWIRSFDIRQEIELDHWVVMPNHFHAIIWINGDKGSKSIDCFQDSEDGMIISNSLSFRRIGVSAGNQSFQTACGPSPRSLGSLIGGFKSSVTRRINKIRSRIENSVWQRNYYEHIIRDEESLNEIREYISNNPSRWMFDRDNPDATVIIEPEILNNYRD